MNPSEPSLPAPIRRANYIKAVGARHLVWVRAVVCFYFWCIPYLFELSECAIFSNSFLVATAVGSLLSLVGRGAEVFYRSPSVRLPGEQKTPPTPIHQHQQLQLDGLGGDRRRHRAPGHLPNTILGVDARHP